MTATSARARAKGRTGPSATELTRELSRLIDQRELRPGDRLKELDLVERFGASRSPVREALRVLEAKGLVVIEANRGATVARLDDSDLEEVLEMRGVMFRLAARRAAARACPAEIRRLGTLARKLARLADSGDEEGFSEIHVDLIMSLLKIAECRRITDFLCDTMPGIPRRLGIVPALTGPAQQRLATEISQFVEALKVGDVARAEAIIEGSYLAQTETVLAMRRIMDVG